MNARKILISAVLLALAIGIIVLVNMLSNSRSQTELLGFFPGASVNTIGTVMLRDASDQTKLQRRGDVWVLLPKTAPTSATSGTEFSGALGTEVAQEKPAAGTTAMEYPVDSGAVNQLLETLVKIRKSTLVSENSAKQVTFGVDSLHGTRIEAFDIAGRSLGEVILGKSSPDYGSNYFRPENSNQVFLVPESNRWSLTADHKHWEDKNILKFDQVQVKQLTIAKNGSSTVVIARADSITKGWQLIKGGKMPLDSNKVNSVLNTLSNFQAAEFEDSAYTDSATGLADPQLTLTINFKSGSSRTVAIGNKKAGQSNYWLKIPEKQYLFLIYDWQYKQLDKKAEDLAYVPPKSGTPIKPTLKPKSPGRVKLPGKNPAKK
ncbi:MAG: DUF4340 domain-containing protein [Chitinispirillaceae bacterium]|jgi:hypothetical protein